MGHEVRLGHDAGQPAWWTGQMYICFLLIEPSLWTKNTNTGSRVNIRWTLRSNLITSKQKQARADLPAFTECHAYPHQFFANPSLPCQQWWMNKWKIALLAAQQVTVLYLSKSLEKYTSLLSPKDIYEQKQSRVRWIKMEKLQFPL